MNRRRAALERTLTEQGDALLAYALALTGDDGDARGLLERALVAVFGRTRPPEAAEATVRRSMRRMAARSTAPPAASPSAAPLDPWEDTVSALGRALARLTPRQRALVVMRYVDGMSADAIAMDVGGSPAAIRMELGAAAEALQRAAPGSGVDVDDARYGGGAGPDQVQAPWSVVEVGGSR